MTNRSYGDCYQASLEGAEELAEIKRIVEKTPDTDSPFKRIYDHLNLSESIEVVHGEAVPSDGIDKGRTILHAWIEVGNKVIETSNSQKLPFDLKEYYENYGVKPIIRYTVQQARSLANQHGSYCAWHTK